MCIVSMYSEAENATLEFIIEFLKSLSKEQFIAIADLIGPNLTETDFSSVAEWMITFDESFGYDEVDRMLTINRIYTLGLRVLENDYYSTASLTAEDLL